MQRPLSHDRRPSFDALDQIYAARSVSDDERALFGAYVLTDAHILDTPLSVQQMGHILTNPSQIELYLAGGVEAPPALPFAYFRSEPPKLHLGKTRAEPYLILQGKTGVPELRELSEARVLPGEDPRITKDVKLRTASGKVHSGWLVSTVVASPKADDPEVAESIKQVFYWGTTLSSLEPVNELPGIKNTCIYPINGDDSDTSIDVFGRPHPHITYLRAPSIDQLTTEMVLTGINITEGFLPPGVHTGVNFIKGIPGHPEYRELDLHTAVVEYTATGKKILHYRTERAGFRLPSPEFPKGRFIPLGVTATSSMFAGAVPKPPDACVESYGDIVYGSLGHPSNGLMATGVNDSCAGIARIVRL